MGVKMDLTTFEQEKSRLHIDEAVMQALESIPNGDFEKVLNILQPLTIQFEQGIKIENSESDEYYSFSDNIEYFTKLIENSHNGFNANINALNPNYSRMYHLLGYVYIELKNNEHAHDSLVKALNLNPVSAGTYLELAEIYKKSAQWEKFLPLAQNALKYAKTPSTIARSLRGLGYYYCEQKNYPLATALYMHSLQFEDNKEIVGTEVGYMYELTGKTLELPTPDDAVKIILENGLDVEMTNYTFAGYAKFLQVLKEANQQEAFLHYIEELKKMVFSPDKIEYLNSI